MKERKSHILIVSTEFPPQPGGIGNHAYHLALELSKHAYKVDLIADQRSIDGIEEQEFDVNLPFTVHRTKLRSFRLIMYLIRCIRVFKAVKNADHVIASGKFSLWIVGFCTLFNKKDFIAVVHGTEVNFKSFVLRKSIASALKRFNTIVAVSNYTKSLIAHLKKHVVVIHNGIDISNWKDKVETNLNISGHPKLITVGNVTSRKGQLNVIRHLPLLLKTFPNVHYHCLGIPTEAEAFNEVAKQLKVQKHVTFHGRVSDTDLKSMLSNSDVFIMLSSETSSGDVEGFGIAVLEANALGIPAIGSKGCGIEDAINDHNSGILIDHKDGQALFSALSEILENKDTFSQNAIKWAAEHSWSNIIKSYIKEFRV